MFLCDSGSEALQSTIKNFCSEKIKKQAVHINEIEKRLTLFTMLLQRIIVSSNLNLTTIY